MPNDLRYKPQSQKTLASTSYKALFSGKSLKLPSDSRELARQKFKTILKEKLLK